MRYLCLCRLCQLCAGCVHTGCLALSAVKITTSITMRVFAARRQRHGRQEGSPLVPGLLKHALEGWARQRLLQPLALRQQPGALQPQLLLHHSLLVDLLRLSRLLLPLLLLIHCLLRSVCAHAPRTCLRYIIAALLGFVEAFQVG